MLRICRRDEAAPLTICLPTANASGCCSGFFLRLYTRQTESYIRIAAGIDPPAFPLHNPSSTASATRHNILPPPPERGSLPWPDTLMTPHAPLQPLRNLDNTSPQFHTQLIDFLSGDEYQSVFPTLQREDLTWLVEYLDSVSFQTIFSPLCAQKRRRFSLASPIPQAWYSRDAYTNSAIYAAPRSRYQNLVQF